MKALAVARLARPSARASAGAAAIFVFALSFGGGVLLYDVQGIRPGPNEYNLAAWELRNLPGKWLFAFGALFRAKPSLQQENETLRRFFQLTREIGALEGEVNDARQRGAPPDAAKVNALAERRRERDRIENRVEATIEGRLTKVLEREGIGRSFLFFPSLVWPPVDFEFTDAPRTLAVSPRDRIQLIGSSLLREDLTLNEVEAIEQAKASEGLSALAFPASGIGAYPTIVDYTGDYGSAVETIAHEWMHTYLFFRPLGFNYYKDNDLRTLNETVADIVGRELARAVVAAWPLDDALSAPPAQRSGIDVGAELRRLRGEVEALLSQGKIDAAEALMEQRRQELAAQGAFLRKLNQAYFAYTNLYASPSVGSPAATNPIGPKVDELRRRLPSLRRFVDVVGGLTSVRDLDRALAAASND